MGAQEVSLRVAFDTNTVISALLFRGRLDWLHKAWLERSLFPLANKATVQELYHVLSYPKFDLSEGDREELLGDYLPFAELVKMPSRLPALLKCRDSDDQKFIELAHVSKANMRLQVTRIYWCRLTRQSSGFVSRAHCRPCLNVPYSLDV